MLQTFFAALAWKYKTFIKENRPHWFTHWKIIIGHNTASKKFFKSIEIKIYVDSEFLFGKVRISNNSLERSYTKNHEVKTVSTQLQNWI